MLYYLYNSHSSSPLLTANASFQMEFAIVSGFPSTARPCMRPNFKMKFKLCKTIYIVDTSSTLGVEKQCTYILSMPWFLQDNLDHLQQMSYSVILKGPYSFQRRLNIH